MNLVQEGSHEIDILHDFNIFTKYYTYNNIIHVEYYLFDCSGLFSHSFVGFLFVEPPLDECTIKFKGSH